MKAKAVVFPALDQIEIREVEIADMQADQVRVETLYSFVSPGTELRCLAGYYGAKKNYPLIPGYATVSRVVEVGSQVKGIRVGDILSCRQWNTILSGERNYFGGQVSTHIFTPNTEIVLLPEEAAQDPLPYTAVEVAAISYNGVNLTNPAPGESVAVLGQGMIGTCSAEFFRMCGCRVTVGDVDDNRLKAAAQNGFKCVDLKDSDAMERMLRFSDNIGFDVVSECSGSTDGFKMACKLLRKEYHIQRSRRYDADMPRLLCQASYVEEIPLRPDIFFLGERIKFLTPSDRKPEDRMQVAELIRSGKWDPSKFIKNVFTPDEFIEAYRKLQKKEILTAVFRWQ